jgi:hypothetical protein
VLFLLACTHPDSKPGAVEEVPSPWGEDDGSAVYDPDVLHEVTFTLDAADWEALRVQERTYYDLLGPGCMEGPFDSPYTWFDADMTFDGESVGTVAVRKKGLIGSNSWDRPSLRVDTDDRGAGRFHGLEKLVFNNNNQDESRMRTCVAHRWFTDAGLVAPRCSLAHVTVNGEDLGVYDNTEAIEPELVERVLGEPPTSMYEGALSDFRDGWEATFESELDGSDGTDIAAVTDALASDDDTLLEALDGPLDLDAFFTFWAAEAFAGHWDGYNGNTNNFYVYGAPEDGRLRFIASGPDAAFDSRTPFDPIWAPTVSALANRLIQHEEGRARYEAELTRLATDVWDADAALTRIDAWKELARDAMTVGERRAVSDLADVVAAKADDILGAIGGDVEPAALRGDFCWVDIGTVEVEFATEYGTYPYGDLYGEGRAETTYVLRDVSYPSTANGVTVGDYDGQAIWLTISEIAPDVYLAPYVVFDPDDLVDGAVITIDGGQAEGGLLYASADTGGTFQTAAYIQGTLTIESGAAVDGADVEGVLEASVLGAEK